MKSRILVTCVVAVAVAFAFVASASAVTEPGLEPGSDGEKAKPERHVVRTWIKKPPKKVRKKDHFKPESHPTPGEVREIARLEQKRWGGPSILGRIACESGYRWNATNGQYRGLLQIGPIWGALWSGTPRKVKFKTKKKVKKPVWRYRKWSDGTKGRVKIRWRKVKKVTIHKGKLPSGSDPYHGWAAIRVGQRAVAGYATTSWSCGL